MSRLPRFEPDHDIDDLTYPWLIDEQSEVGQSLRATKLRLQLLREIHAITDKTRQGKLLSKLYMSDIMPPKRRLWALELLEAEVRKGK